MLFRSLQVFVDEAIVTDAQNCGNILAGVGPFAIEKGLVAPTGEETAVTIFMANTGQIAVARVATPGGRVTYRGEARIDGVGGLAEVTRPSSHPARRCSSPDGSSPDERGQHLDDVCRLERGVTDSVKIGRAHV